MLDCEQMVDVVRRRAVAKLVRRVKVGPVNLRASRPSRNTIYASPPNLHL